MHHSSNIKNNSHYMSTFNIIVSIIIADILSVSVFVLLDWKPVDVWDRAKALARNIVKAIIPIVKSVSVNNNHKVRGVGQILPAIIVIDQRGVYRQLTRSEVRELYARLDTRMMDSLTAACTTLQTQVGATHPRKFSMPFPLSWNHQTWRKTGWKRVRCSVTSTVRRHSIRCAVNTMSSQNVSTHLLRNIETQSLNRHQW